MHICFIKVCHPFLRHIYYIVIKSGISDELILSVLFIVLFCQLFYYYNALNLVKCIYMYQ